jgi:hypothetical protein
VRGDEAIWYLVPDCFVARGTMELLAMTQAFSAILASMAASMLSITAAGIMVVVSR